MTRSQLSDRLIALGDEAQSEYPDAAGLIYTIATAVITEQDANFLRRMDPLVKELLLLTKLAKAMKGNDQSSTDAS
jgi:hypothetical protein